MKIILGNPGCASEIVSAVIDSTDCSINYNGSINAPLRTKFIDVYHPNKLNEYDTIYSSYDKSYLAVASHMYSYHYYRMHDVTIIAYDDIKWVDISKKRLCKIYPNIYPGISIKMLHGNKVWIHKFKSINLSNKVVCMSDIFEGRLLDVLSSYGYRQLNEDLYKHWLTFDNNIPSLY